MRASLGVFAVVAVILAPLGAACGGSDGGPANQLPPSDQPGTGNDAGATQNDAGGGSDGNASSDSAKPSDGGDTSARPPLPQLVSGGGPTLKNPKVVPIFYPGYTWTSQITDWLSKLGATPYWSATTSEYGVGPLNMGTPVTLTDPAPAAITSQQIAALLKSKLDGTHPEFGTIDPQTVYMMFFPKETQIDGAQGSCTSYGGYHENLSINGQSIPYAVLPECPTFGPVNGLDMVTGAGSHELIEAATDPYPSGNAAYSGLDDPSVALEVFLGGNAENGDMCSVNWDAFFKPAGEQYVVQRGWSNAAAKLGHEPCVPLNPADQPYFAAAPVLTDTATVLGVQAKVIKIAVGETKTIDVMAWSDGPVNVPWTVQAKQPRRVTTPQLELKFDKTTAQNGDTLKLTIKVLAASTRKYESFAIESNIGNQRTYWAGLVTQP